jgi:toxin ParE1/3/4
MGHQVILAPLAKHDLREIVRYISQDSPQRAIGFGQFLITQAKKLGDFPEIGRVAPEFTAEGLREIVVRSYRVIYRIHWENRRVEILRSWHAARGFPRLAQP